MMSRQWEVPRGLCFVCFAPLASSVTLDCGHALCVPCLPKLAEDVVPSSAGAQLEVHPGVPVRCTVCRVRTFVATRLLAGGEGGATPPPAEGNNPLRITAPPQGSEGNSTNCGGTSISALPPSAVTMDFKQLRAQLLNTGSVSALRAARTYTPPGAPVALDGGRCHETGEPSPKKVAVNAADASPDTRAAWMWGGCVQKDDGSKAATPPPAAANQGGQGVSPLGSDGCETAASEDLVTDSQELRAGRDRSPLLLGASAVGGSSVAAVASPAQHPLAPPHLPASTCGVCQGPSAVFCAGCHHGLCSRCRANHALQPATARHVVRPVPLEAPTPSLSPLLRQQSGSIRLPAPSPAPSHGAARCPTHGVGLTLYDTAAHTAVCPACVAATRLGAGRASSGGVLPLDVALGRVTDELDSALQVAGTRREDLHAMILRVERELPGAIEDVGAPLLQRVAEMRRVLDGIERSVAEDLDALRVRYAADGAAARGQCEALLKGLGEAIPAGLAALAGRPPQPQASPQGPPNPCRDVLEDIRAARTAHERLAELTAAPLPAVPSAGALERVKLMALSALETADPRVQLARGSRGGRLLGKAAGCGLQAVCREVLALGVPVDAVGTDGCTALMHAAAGGHEEVCRMLVDVGANPSTAGETDTAMVAAAETASADAAAADDEVFCESPSGGDDPESDTTDTHARSTPQPPVVLAAGGGHRKIVEMLSASGVAVADARGVNGQTALLAALDGGHMDVLTDILERDTDRLLRADAPQGLRPLATQHNDDGVTPLMVAAKHGHYDACKMLLEHVKNLPAVDASPSNSTVADYVNAVDKTGAGALIWVCRGCGTDDDEGRGNVQVGGKTDMREAICSILLRAGADVSAATKDQKTALMLAAKGGDAGICARLIEHGADCQQKCADGSTPLMQAAAGGHLGVCQRLLAHLDAASVSTWNYSGLTALAMAAMSGHEDIAEAILATGVSPDERVQFGEETALTLAAREGHGEMCGVLVRLGAAVDCRVEDGTTALMVAAGAGHVHVCDTLLSLRADPNAVKDNGETALMVAAFHGCEAVCEILVSRGADVFARNDGQETAQMLAARLGFDFPCLSTTKRMRSEATVEVANKRTRRE